MAHTALTHTAQDRPASRQIRVFLSSTFRDFMEERDLLVKQVFPALRRRAQERGVEMVDVDLRWGVTQEAGLPKSQIKLLSAVGSRRLQGQAFP